MVMPSNGFIPHIRVYADLPGHPKLFALAQVLDLPREHVMGMLLNLWLSVLSTSDGCLLADESTLARVMEWAGDPHRLARAMIDTRWLDTEYSSAPLTSVAVTGRRWHIHNWEHYNGPPALWSPLRPPALWSPP